MSFPKLPYGRWTRDTLPRAVLDRTNRRRQLTPVFTSSNLASLVCDIWQSSLHLSHPRYLGQQNGAPIPAAALVESVVGSLNQSLAVWEMSPIAGISRRTTQLEADFRLPEGCRGLVCACGAFEIQLKRHVQAHAQPTQRRPGTTWPIANRQRFTAGTRVSGRRSKFSFPIAARRRGEDIKGIKLHPDALDLFSESRG